MSRAAAIMPGATLGVLGGGQLARMFAMAARRLGYEVVVFAPDKDTPAGQVCPRTVTADYGDGQALREFAAQVEVVTLEFENVPAQALETIEATTPVRPGSQVLAITQNRLKEKSFLAERGFPVTPFRAVRGVEQLLSELPRVGPPAVLKTVGFGYDGKGQRLIASDQEAAQAFAELGSGEMVLERFVRLAMELSVIGARGIDGSFACFGPVENRHCQHILDVSAVPAAVSAEVADRAVALTKQVMEALDVVGLLCVEFFLSQTGELLVNELAPRPHNSGHYSIEACPVSQFEQQVRAITGLPLGATELLKPAAMANLLGDLWAGGEPDWTRVLCVPGVSLHLYGKREARPGRKMGHLTALAASAQAARDLVLAARGQLSQDGSLVR
ncbi:MAG TPA: 5-(carboxyamino)imidazole ribonucleotide synthase [Candidatus Obscuribacterales bacterium]